MPTFRLHPEGTPSEIGTDSLITDQLRGRRPSLTTFLRRSGAAWAIAGRPILAYPNRSARFRFLHGEP